MEFKHVPVMLGECMTALNLKPDGIYFDGTLGGAGHSKEILRLSGGKLIATDLDTEALAAAEKNLQEYKGRYTLVHDNFKNFKSILDKLGVEAVDGVLLDLGVSSHQLDDRSRGFSYMAKEELLDMKMNQCAVFSAYDVVNGYSESELARILWEYGEEKFSRKIAENIVKERKNKPIRTCGELVGIIEKSISFKHMDGHPAKRTFQAIRIEVNGELKGLADAIKDMAFGLKKGGRLAVITFHSLEDRIVKNVFRDLSTDCICDKSLPICVCGRKKEVEIVNKKPIVAGESEVVLNPRAKSAKLRVCEKL